MKQTFFGTALWALTSVLASCMVLRSPTPATDPMMRFQHTIYTGTNASPELLAAARDLQYNLQRATAQVFSIRQEQGAGPGIYLSVRNPATKNPQTYSRLYGASSHAFYLYRQAERMVIDGQSEKALRYAVYEYMRRLGFRWYFPGELWTIIPRLEDIRLDLDEAVIPDFRIRNFFGTGGLPPHPVLDPQNARYTEWLNWMTANGFGSEYYIQGHMGETFNLVYKNTLLANPSMIAEVKGARNWSESAKPCISNAAFRQLFVKDRLEAYERQRAKDPNDVFHTFAIGVDPADGGGHCECEACRRMGSVSDRVFGLANETARNLRSRYPDANVNLFAYNIHAELPKAPLETNVYIGIVGSAFQDVASPERFIEMWAGESRRFFVYDYWVMPDWSIDKPDGDYLAMAASLRRWHDKYPHGDGVLLESSFSIGAAGPGLYLFGRLMWDTKSDPQAVLDEMFNTLFGPSAPPVQRMMARWRSGLIGGSHLAFDYRDLDEASRLANTPAVKARLDAFKQYLHYLRLRDSFERLPAGDTPQRKAAAEELMRYIWQISGTKMIHSDFQCQKLMHRSGVSGLDARWAYGGNNTQSDVYQSIRPLSAEQIRSNFESGKTSFPVQYEPAPPPAVLIAGDIAAGRSAVSPREFLLRDDHTLVYEAKAGGELLRFEAKASLGQYDWQPYRFLTVLDEQGNAVAGYDAPVNDRFETVEIRFPAPGRYRLSWRIKRCSLYLRWPAHAPLVFEKHLSLSQPPARAWFFVPEGLNRIAIDPSRACAVNIFMPDGREAAVQRESESLAWIDVPPAMQGQRWSFKPCVGDRNFGLLNVPSLFALDEQTLIAPRRE